MQVFSTVFTFASTQNECDLREKISAGDKRFYTSLFAHFSVKVTTCSFQHGRRTSHVFTALHNFHSGHTPLWVNFSFLFKFHRQVRFFASWKTLKVQVKLILNCPRALVITCLSHPGQNFVQRTTFKVLLWRKQVCQLSLKNRLAVWRVIPFKINH